MLLISGNIYPGVGSLSSAVALVSKDSCKKCKNAPQTMKH